MRYSIKIRLFILVLLLFVAVSIYLKIISSSFSQFPVCKGCNIVFIDIDILRADHLGCYGYHLNTSPNIDSLAAKSLIFEDAFAQSPITFSSHMAILTSLYPSCSDVKYPEADMLSTQVKTLNQILHENNYETVVVAPKNAYQLSPSSGFNRGVSVTFDIDQTEEALQFARNIKSKPFFLSFYFADTHDPYFPTPEALNHFKEFVNLSNPLIMFDLGYYHDLAYVTLFENEGIMKDILNEKEFIRYKEYLNRVTELNNSLKSKIGVVMEFINNVAEEPEKLGYAFVQMSYPLIRKYYFDRFNLSDRNDIELIRTLYDATIYDTDILVGEILSWLESNGYLNRTLIVITSDHGEDLFEHGFFGHFDINDETTHVPLIIYTPKIAHLRVKGIVESIDIMPTLLGMVGIPMPVRIQGENLFTLILNKRNISKKYAFSEVNDILSVRSSDWRLNLYENDSLQLLNVVNGSDNPVDVSGLHPLIVNQLKAVIEEWHKQNLQCPNKATRVWRPGLPERVKQNLIKTGYW